ncbi:MAG: GAF domain-containing protein, partial [Proteobacteria bacterium]|nr:GAF domain-containing protein [Pseudomonadota bacterium]
MAPETTPPADDDQNDLLAEAEHKVVEKILSDLDTPNGLNQELQRTLENLVTRLEASAGRIYLAGPRGKNLRLAAHQGLGPEFVSQVKVRSPRVGLTGEAAARGETVTLDADHRPEQDLSHLEREGLESVVAVPVLAGGKVLGAINLADKKVRRFSEENLRLLDDAAGNVALAIRLARMKDDLARQEERIRDLCDTVGQLKTA